MSFSLEFYFQKNKISTYVNFFQKKINEKEVELNNILSRLKKDYSSEFFISNPQKANSFFETNGFIFLVYKQDSLKYWSSNALPANEIYDKNIFNKNFIHYKNGWYIIKQATRNKEKLIGFILIKKDFAYENDNLKNEFQKDFINQPNVEISLKKNSYPIYSINKSYLFSLEFGKEFTMSLFKKNMILSLYILAFILFSISIYLLNKQLFKKNRFNISEYIYLLEMFLLAYLSINFHFPDILYKTPLFNPYFFAYSESISSLGHVLIYSIIINSFSILFYKNQQVLHAHESNKYLRRILCIFGFIFVYILFYYFIFLIRTLIYNSQLTLDFSNILGFTTFSYVILFIISINLFSYILITNRVLTRGLTYISGKEFILISTIVSLSIFWYAYYFSSEWMIYILPFIFIYIHYFLKKYNRRFESFISITLLLILFSSFLTYYLNRQNSIKERQYRSLLAVKLTTERDPMAEYLFEEIEKELTNDQNLFKFLKNNNIDDNRISQYIQKKYFDDYWLKYNIQITICKASDSLFIKPDNYKTSCENYFSARISRHANPTICQNLYFMDDPSGRKWYLGRIPLTTTEITYSIYLDIIPKNIPKDLTYPQLLVDKKAKIFMLPNIYTYAKYFNGKLINQNGKYYYNYQLSSYPFTNEKIQFAELNGYDHMLFKMDDSTDLIISKPKLSILNLIAPFSYLFLFLGVCYGVIFIFLKIPFSFLNFHFSFKNRLQITIISVILISFILIGITSVLYITQLNENKNNETINEKAHSILIEVEHLISNTERITPDMYDYINGILIRLSNIYFTDINLYDLKGNLIATSRPKIFDEELISTKINPIAFYRLKYFQNTLFTHKEKIGGLEFLSTYIPFRNVNNQTIAYLNLPYFAKQNELKDEIAGFISTFINIYFLLISLAIGITLLISNYITRPLGLIKEKISRLSLGKKNEKIEWGHQDEIGNLISEYNRMVDELANSAELLARSERESAWREMAKQIAHEIKNPLTPLKLNIQNIYKAWQDKAPDLEKRFERFREITLEQIDTLSSIATQFSEFAKIPLTKKQSIDLNKIIQNSIDLYKEFSYIKFNFHQQEPALIYADKDQLLRVFNNLIKNSIQALETNPDGQIEIHIIPEQSSYIIEIKDNGPGIPEDKKDKIFMVNFTTKTSGMGLGLAMAKSIIENHNGKIWFHSEIDHGTSFFISLLKTSFH